MPEPSYLTSDGARKLREELAEMVTTKREELSKRLRAAIQQGDLSENADYIQAKEEQAFLEGRIIDLQRILRDVVIIEDQQLNKEMVTVGAKVQVQEGNFPPEMYYIVGPKEADPVNGWISHESPIGQALIGHRVGETVSAKIPNGEITLKIISIE
jgi:transcription elongation factor GreA